MSKQFGKYCLSFCLTLKPRDAFSIGHRLYGERFAYLIIQKFTQCLQIMYTCVDGTLFFFSFLNIEVDGQQTYTHDDGTCKYLHKMTAFPFLPKEDEAPMFECLSRQPPQPNYKL